MEAGALRIGKIPPGLSSCKQTKWYHPACIFASFKRVRALTKTITAAADLQGFDHLAASDQALITSLIATHTRSGRHAIKPRAPAATPAATAPASGVASSAPTATAAQAAGFADASHLTPPTLSKLAAIAATAAVCKLPPATLVPAEPTEPLTKRLCL